MNGLGKALKNPIRKIRKNQNETTACEQKLNRESEFLFKHCFLTPSHRITTRFCAKFPVSTPPKSLLQFDFKNHENM